MREFGDIFNIVRHALFISLDIKECCQKTHAPSINDEDPLLACIKIHFGQNFEIPDLPLPLYVRSRFATYFIRKYNIFLISLHKHVLSIHCIVKVLLMSIIYIHFLGEVRKNI